MKTIQLFLSLSIFITSCTNPNKNQEATIPDSISQIQNKDSIIQVTENKPKEKSSYSITTNVDPNVYTIPIDHPWLLKLIGHPFPWDSLGTCYRVQTFNALLKNAIIKKEQSGNSLITTYSSEDSYVKIAEESFDGMQICSDNICEVFLTFDWMPIGLGLYVGMPRAEFLEAVGLDMDLTQNWYRYTYKPDNSTSLSFTFEFENNLMSSFRYKISPYTSLPIQQLPNDPFFTKLLNEPFATNNPYEIQKIIKTKLRIKVAGTGYDSVFVEALSESDIDPEFLFDGSTISFRKWPIWEIVYVDLKSPDLSFINGLKVGITRESFLKLMGEKDFEGDEFHKWNSYCMDGFNRENDLTILFNEGIITEITYSRLDCNR